MSNPVASILFCLLASSFARSPASADPDPSSSLDRELIRRVVREHIDEIRYCYNQGLLRDPDLAGRIVVRFTVGSTGSVTRSEVQESTLHDPQVGTCAAAAVRSWKFPPPRPDGEVVVSYPFELEPG